MLQYPALYPLVGFPLAQIFLNNPEYFLCHQYPEKKIMEILQLHKNGEKGSYVLNCILLYSLSSFNLWFSGGLIVVVTMIFENIAQDATSRLR